MFYSNNDNYMQDLYFYNQIPNGTYMNNLGGSIPINPNVQSNQINPMTNNVMFQDPRFIPNNYSGTNINNLYPSIYRIINPVISRVVSNNNQPVTEELLNNMTDTVFNIVEGQIDLADDQIQKTVQNESQNSLNSSNNSQSRPSDQSRTSNIQTQSKCSRNDYLLKDFIKTLIIKELLQKNQMQRQFSGTIPRCMPYYNNVFF